MQQNDKCDYLDRTAQQLEQEIVELGFGAGSPFFEPYVGDKVEDFRDVERQENVDQRRDIFPKRLAKRMYRSEDFHSIQAEGEKMLIDLLHSKQPGWRICMRDGGHLVGIGLGSRPRTPKRHDHQHGYDGAIKLFKFYFHGFS